MRGRLRRKLLKAKTAAKLRAMAGRMWNSFYEAMPGESAEDRMLKVRFAMWHADMECYRRTGRQMFTGVAWVKTEDGPLARWDQRKVRQA